MSTYKQKCTTNEFPHMQIKEVVKNKQEKIDANLKELHKDMVVKKPKVAANNVSIKKNKKAPANTNNVSLKLDNLKF